MDKCPLKMINEETNMTEIIYQLKCIKEKLNLINENGLNEEL